MTALPWAPTLSHQFPSLDLDPNVRVASAAYLARFKGQTRVHAESDLRQFLAFCSSQGLDPLDVDRTQLEVYLRWMQGVRGYAPSTVSRRLSIVAGFYRTCVIDGRLTQSAAEHVRRPRVPQDSPTLGLSHLQFEALLAAGRDSADPNDLALVVMLGLLGLRIIEATGANIEASARYTGTGCFGCSARETRRYSHRCRPPWPGPSTGVLSVGSPGPSCAAEPAQG
jgi:site-specific recombinase XerD